MCLGAGKYLEIFGRKNNLRNFWVTIGNEVTGTGQSPCSLDQAQELTGMSIFTLHIQSDKAMAQCRSAA